MSRWIRFLLADSLICLPLLLTLALEWLLFLRVLPVLEEQEADRVRAAYREIARDVKDGEAADVMTRPADGHQRAGRLSKGYWGVEDVDGRKFVWYRAPRSEELSGVLRDPVATLDWRGKARLFGGLLLLTVLLFTNAGLRRFRRFTRERDDFLAAAAHDLATPLVGLRMTIGRDDETAKALNERMLRLVDNLKDFLRLGGRRKTPERTDFEIGRAFDEAYRLFAADYAEEPSGPVAVIGDKSLRVLADETLTVQILWNLLGNDLKYAAPYGKVTATFAADGDTVEFRLADEGPGMSSAERRKAFDRYYRARTARTGGKGGFGIGLCTAWEFARAMEGDLTVEQNTPQGCLFRLVLPKA